jgi:FBP C-terminal treble-clef zinc-finger
MSDAMDPLEPADLSSAFVNVTKGAAARIPLPDLDGTRWETLDFLGWRDPGNPSAAWFVAPYDGRPCGVALRLPSASGPSRKQSMCSLCHTVHSASGVALMAAARAGRPGRDGNTVGTYLCTDLACSLYARGVKKPDRVQPHETVSVETKVARLQHNLDTFLRRVLT